MISILPVGIMITPSMLVEVVRIFTQRKISHENIRDRCLKKTQRVVETGLRMIGQKNIEVINMVSDSVAGRSVTNTKINTRNEGYFFFYRSSSAGQARGRPKR